MGTFAHDLRFALRNLIRNPGFTFVAVLTLALGIGANATMFSVLNNVLLRKLPFHDPDRLVTVWEVNMHRPDNLGIVSQPNFEDYRKQNHVFDSMAMFDSAGRGYNLAALGAQDPEQVSGLRVTANFFDVLGVAPIIGRGFTPEEETHGKGNVVVLSDGLWQRRFGGDRNLVGQTIRMDGELFTVVGVMPPGFNFQFWSGARELWVPMDYTEGDHDRGAHSFIAFGRMKNGVTLAQTNAEMDTIGRRLAAQYPTDNHETTVTVRTADSEGSRDLRGTLFALNGVVAFVLLIACVNVANLMLARGASRRKEFAIRCALGAGRWRVIRQLMTESLLLALFGCIAGVTAASWTSGLLTQILPSGLKQLPFHGKEVVSVDTYVLAFATAISVLTGVLFGLVPALNAFQNDPNEPLKQGGDRGTTLGGGSRLRHALVAVEMALALVVLFGAGLMIESVRRVLEIPPGFDARNVLALEVTTPQQEVYNGPPGKPRFCQDLDEHAAPVPGVKSVSAAAHLPMNGGASRNFKVEGQPEPPPGQRPGAAYSVACPNYFRTMGIPVTKGRDFTFADTLQSPPVIVINEAMADRHWRGENPLGKRIFQGEKWRTVIGVIGNVHHWGLDGQPPEMFYVPYTQAAWPWMDIVVKTAGAPTTYEGAMRKAIRDFDPDMPVGDTETMEQIVQDSVAPRRFPLILLSVFAALALALAAVGIAGVVGFSVVQRTHEIGIRMALGARTTDVLETVLARTMTWAFGGVVAGVIGALFLAKALGQLLFDIAPTDPNVLITVSLGLLAVALAASSIPARRAAKVDPMQALRN